MLNICFFTGPDICGPGTKKVHVIFSYKGKNLLINKDIRCKDDIYTHLYTLIVKPDNTYKVKKMKDKSIMKLRNISNLELHVLINLL